MDLKEIIGKHVHDVIPTTKIHKTVEMKTPAIADPYFLENATLISTRYPIYEKDGTFFGVVEYDLFDNYDLLNNFVKKIESLIGIIHLLFITKFFRKQPPELGLGDSENFAS
ncbi:hypothetical protein [Bacillus salipaludis]|uniref:Uncharacterized protein n=1 Tax=Bacillus salipaludis TaxID=2547811 RepID=A0AA90R600_9BACI|nr:hypothetical protein [Bacillus salipaludis]MDQ6595941.1 hypothetical protein [Bacillus salipaludis]